MKWRKKLGDPFFKEQVKLELPEEEQDEQNPKIMSWYYSGLGLSGTRGHDLERNATIVEMLKREFKIPYFMTPTKLNEQTVEGRLEFFFGTEGAGVHPHTDPICQWIFSAQMAGAKSWRLTLPYNIDLMEQANPGYKFKPSDGNQLLAMMSNKLPIYEFTLKAGEMMFFPPGLIHTTKAVGPECSTSVSLQFAEPNPVLFVKEFSNYLISDVIGASKCFVDHFNMWLFGDYMPNKDASPQSNIEFIESRWKELDKDRSGVVTKKEALAYMKKHATISGGGLIEDSPELDMESFWAAHDTNGDGVISKPEFAQTVHTYWTPRMAQVALAWDAPRPISFFLDADKNGDEYLTEEELKETFPKVKWSSIMNYDDDGDGKLFQGEFNYHIPEMYEIFTGTKMPANHPDNEEADLDDTTDDKAPMGGTAASIKELNRLASVEGAEVTSDSWHPVLQEAPEPPVGGIDALKLSLDRKPVHTLWNVDESAKLPISPVSVKDISEEQFLPYGRRGQPLIVKDGLKGMLAEKAWNTDYFRKEFGAEDVTRCWNCDYKKLSEGETKPATLWKYLALGPNSEIGAEQPIRSEELTSRLQKETTIPYFLPKSTVNVLTHNEYLDVYMGGKGGTQGPHTDMVCFWSVFGQAQGSSKWKLTVPYDAIQLQRDNPGYVYSAPDGFELVDRMVNEHAIYEFTLNEGELLVVPPGLFKDFVLTGDSGNTLFRLSFMDPAPISYLRGFYQPLMSDSDGAAGCYTDHYNKWLFGKALPDSLGTKESNDDFAQRVFEEIDTSKDGKITLDEAKARFPGTVEAGPVRTSEMDGASFMAANDRDQDGAVTVDNVKQSIQQLWNPVMRDVGMMWHYVDSKNLESDGAFEDYGKYVDSIRFDLKKLEPGYVADGSQTKKKEEERDDELDDLDESEFPKRDPPSNKEQSVPGDFELSVNKYKDNVMVAVASSGEGLGFIHWPSSKKWFVGYFKGGKRNGAGVFCCMNDELDDQLWTEGDEKVEDWTTKGVAQSTNSKAEPKKSSAELEIMEMSDGMVWMGKTNMSGVGFVHWPNGDVFFGHFENAKRLGKGLFVKADGTKYVQEWKEGDDSTDWKTALQMTE